MIQFIRKIIPDRFFLRLWYHKMMAILANLVFQFPSRKLRVIGITGTSGKSSTVEMTYFLLQRSGQRTGFIGTSQIVIGENKYKNKNLRTTLSAWKTAKILRKMVKSGCKNAILEVSSHALDQNRVWGIAFDVVLITNIFNNEHLDYHPDFSHYFDSKLKLLNQCLLNQKKLKYLKTIIVNKDDENYPIYDRFIKNKPSISLSTKEKHADIFAKNIDYSISGVSFSIVHDNHQYQFKRIPFIGEYNLSNFLFALGLATYCEIPMKTLCEIAPKFPGVPGRMERIANDQGLCVFVDYSYKPLAIERIFSDIKQMTSGKCIVVWGPAGGRSQANIKDSCKLLNKYVDEIVLTTDDPHDLDPQEIFQIASEYIGRQEGEGFFEIEDRYEAIRYAITIAEKDDIVVIAGRGNEPIQIIGKHKIPFDDREITREILTIKSQR